MISALPRLRHGFADVTPGMGSACPAISFRTSECLSLDERAVASLFASTRATWRFSERRTCTQGHSDAYRATRLAIPVATARAAFIVRACPP